MKEVRTYVWRQGARFKVNPQDAGEALRKLREKNDGFVSARQVVEAARSEKHPLHDDFDWDDGRAAELYRETTARSIIRSLRVEVRIIGEEKPSEPQRVHVAVRTEKKNADDKLRRYADIKDIVSDEEYRNQMLFDAFRLLSGIMDRYRELDELAGVRRAVDALARKVERLKKSS